MNTNFEILKSEILRRAKVACASFEQYMRAYKAEDMSELCIVIKEHFHWACKNQVLTVDLLNEYRSEFAEHDIYVNQSVERGFMLCDTATVEAFGNVIVEAFGNATVKAFDNVMVNAFDNATVIAFDTATVIAFDNVTVNAFGNATVEAFDNVTVKAYGNTYCISYSTIECKLSDNAIYRIKSSNTIYYASDNIKFEKQ